VILTTSARS